MYGVYHEDKRTRYLLKLFDDVNEAKSWVKANYGDRLWPAGDRDTVYLLDEDGNYIDSWKVDWMPVFDAVKSWNFRSSSGSGQYRTQLNATGLLSCNCRGWTFKKQGKPRSCKHTTEVAENEGYRLKVIGDYLFVEDKALKTAKSKFSGASTPEQKFMQLIAEYENAIERMAKLEPKDMLLMAEEVEICKFKVDSYLLLLEDKGVDGMAAYDAAQAKLGAIFS
jgi:hypothetical protein